jgi:hypothetical protein
LGRQHPVEQHAVGDRATQATESRPHGGDDDARPLGQKLAKLGDTLSQRVQLRV